jgi:hypothetical protein
MRQTLMAGASTFAHLLGRATAKAAAEDDDDKQREGESDEDFEKRKKDKATAAKAAAEDDDDKQREGESDEDFEKRKKDKAKGKRAEGDDDEDGGDDSDGADMRSKGAARSARLRERARCDAIFSDAAAGKNPALAAQLAFRTDLPRGQAVAVLRAGGLAVSERRPSLDDRMAAVKVPALGVGDAAQPTGAQGLAAQIVAAGRKRRGEG